MFKHIIFILTTLLCSVSLSAQTVPTSYEAAKRIGDAKLASLKKTNAPARVQYVVLRKGCRLNKLIKKPNTVYVIDKVYNLKGKTLHIPNHSVLVIRNGNINNGTIVGQNTKYCILGGKTLNCQLTGEWERIDPLYPASELGLRPNNKASSKDNYTNLQEAISRGYNLYLDGDYYVSFDKPIILDYVLNLYGGSLSFSKHAFDLTDGGGMCANGVYFKGIEGPHTDDIVCGTREKHPTITTGAISFINCLFSCNRVVSINFQYANPQSKPFGIKSLTVKNCYSDRNARFITLDAPYLERCLFQNNTFTNFSYAPIYITHNHSIRTHPNEADANPWAEEVVSAMCDVVIDSNIFIGKEVSEYTYYCAALVGAKKCSFTNNYLKDLVNYSDKNSKGYTAYDAYLSCVDVDYDNNYVENMLSYAKDGASKPQNEIGKSKINPLESFGVKSSRRYENNIFICDGQLYLNKGADKSSIVTSIFCNVSPIDSYIWRNNSVIYRDVVLAGRHSSTKYGSFIMNNNYFECAEFSGNIIFPNSAYNCEEISIYRNVFISTKPSTTVLVNQLFVRSFNSYAHGKLSIVDNSFKNNTPVAHFFVADSVQIKNNRVENVSLDKNTYLSNYTGTNTTLSVGSMDTEFVLDTSGQSKGGAHQYFSSSSSGQYFVEMKDVPEKGVFYYYQVGADHDFQIVWFQNGEQNSIGFRIKRGKVTYSYRGHEEIVKFGNTKSIVWNQGSSPVVKITFEKGTPNRIITSLLGHSESTIRLGYIGK